MKKWFIPVLALPLMLAACGAQEKDSKEAVKDTGLSAYQQNSCVGCHGKDMEGASGPNLTKVGAKYSEQEILSIIKNGKGNMPKGQAAGDDAKKIAAYLAKQK